MFRGKIGVGFLMLCFVLFFKTTLREELFSGGKNEYYIIDILPEALKLQKS